MDYEYRINLDYRKHLNFCCIKGQKHPFHSKRFEKIRFEIISHLSSTSLAAMSQSGYEGLTEYIKLLYLAKLQLNELPLPSCSTLVTTL